MTGRRIRIGTSGWHYPGGDGREMVMRYPELEGVVRTEPETVAPLLRVDEPPARG